MNAVHTGEIRSLFIQQIKKSRQKMYKEEAYQLGSYIKRAAGVNDRGRPKRNCLSLNLFHIFLLFLFRQFFITAEVRERLIVCCARRKRRPVLFSITHPKL